jgi:hypothetical protein
MTKSGVQRLEYLMLSPAGADQNRYTVAFSSYLATPTTQAAEAWAPLQWRSRSTNFDSSAAPVRAQPATATQGARVH